jgi:hypothetical protein
MDELKFKDNIGGWCRFYLIEGKLSNKEIVEKVRARFGGKTSISSVAWYASELREKGLLKGGRKGAVELSMTEFKEKEND